MSYSGASVWTKWSKCVKEKKRGPYAVLIVTMLIWWVIIYQLDNIFVSQSWLAISICWTWIFSPHPVIPLSNTSQSQYSMKDVSWQCCCKENREPGWNWSRNNSSESYVVQCILFEYDYILLENIIAHIPGDRRMVGHASLPILIFLHPIHWPAIWYAKTMGP